jgi:predicted ATPase
MRIESIKVKNFKSLQDFEVTNITDLTVIVGKNGVGKTTFFDVFEFLQDCLEKNVNHAIQKRGGYKEVVSRGKENENITFNIDFKSDIDNEFYTYFLELQYKEPFTVIEQEYISPLHGTVDQRIFYNAYGTSFVLIDGIVDNYNLSSPNTLALSIFGKFAELPTICDFRLRLEEWSVSDFNIHSAKNDDNPAIPAEHLLRSGDNLSQVAKFLYDNHRETFDEIIKKMQERIPGISNITADTTVDNRLVLRFKDGTFKDPFLSKYASDGTMKMFAYLVMLNDPKPCSLLCIEEPENQLYPEILEILAEEFREYSTRGQVFVSTHSPDFLNAVDIKEVVLLEKSEGYTHARRLDEDKEIAPLFEDGDKLGWLWNQGYFSDYHHKQQGA